MSASVRATSPGQVFSPWRYWRHLARRAGRLWQRSLRFRTLTMTIALTALTISISCVWLALAIQYNLFSARSDQVLNDAQQATQAAQQLLDSAEIDGDAVRLQNLMIRVGDTLDAQSSSDLIAANGIGQGSALDPLPFTSTSDIDVRALVSDGLRDKVRTGEATQQWWQSIALPGQAGTSSTPGIMVGQQLQVPQSGSWELWLAYDLSAEAQTLGVVQGTLWGVGVVLVLLIGTISWFVLRSITVPVSEAAESSARLAAGELDVRLPVRGHDELATLGRSFNVMAGSIESQIRELAELSLVQQRFVSDVSHELRTPLTTIRLAAEMINDRRDSFDPATSRAAELLNAQVQRFEMLLTDLLEISRYDAGSVQLELEPTSLANLAEAEIESMQPLAAQHGTDLRLVAPGGYSPVDMDPRRVRRIVRNLIGNAIEHGEGRPIVVSVDSNQQAVALGVRDFGMGIRAEDVDRVFDRFWRADPSRKRTIGGTGLGLSIAVGDARLHGGALAVWSELGGGSHFVLTLPRRAGAQPPISPIPADPGDHSVPVVDALGLTQPIQLSAPHTPTKGSKQ